MSDIIENIEVAQLKEVVSAFCTSGTVKVYNKVKEDNRGRIQVFKRTAIKRQDGETGETFTVRKSSNSISVEKTWPLHSPSADNVEAIRKGKVRHAKLSYLGDRIGKVAKAKESVR